MNYSITCSEGGIEVVRKSEWVEGCEVLLIFYIKSVWFKEVLLYCENYMLIYLKWIIYISK